MDEIVLKVSPDNERKQRILRALEEASDRGVERWIWKVLGDWADEYYEQQVAAEEQPAETHGHR